MARTRKYYIEEAAKARCNLNIFHAVIAILEGGTITGEPAQDAAARIIKICKSATQRQINIYDNHVETASQEPAHADH